MKDDDAYDRAMAAEVKLATPAPVVPSWHDHSRGMFAARLEQMQKDGDTWLTITAVFALMADCDMLASRDMIAASPPAPAVAEPLTKPMAWMHDCAGLCTNNVELWLDACPHCGKPRTTTQAQPPKPLTFDQIKEMYAKNHWYELAAFPLTAGSVSVIAAAIEAHHGIGIKGAL